MFCRVRDVKNWPKKLENASEHVNGCLERKDEQRFPRRARDHDEPGELRNEAHLSGEFHSAL